MTGYPAESVPGTTLCVHLGLTVYLCRYYVFNQYFTVYYSLSEFFIRAQEYSVKYEVHTSSHLISLWISILNINIFWFFLYLWCLGKYLLCCKFSKILQLMASYFKYFINPHENYCYYNIIISSVTTSLEYRSRNEDCVHMRHVLYTQCLFSHSAGRPVLRYYCTVTKWSECIIYPVKWRHQQ